MPQPSITKIHLKITYKKFYWNFPWANGWKCMGAYSVVSDALVLHSTRPLVSYIIAPLWGESTIHGWIPLTMGHWYRTLMVPWMQSQAAGDAMMLMWGITLKNLFIKSIFPGLETEVKWNCCDTLQWRHNEPDGVSNQQPHHCLLNHLFKRRSKKTSKLCITGLCEGNSLVTGAFPTQSASNAENVSI